MAGPNGIVDICSHKRSGTHLLMATIWKNFELPDVSVETVMPKRFKFSIGDQVWGPGEKVVIPWGRLWCTHDRFCDQWKKDALYIVRHPINTLISYWRFWDPMADPAKYLNGEAMTYWLSHAMVYTDSCEWIRYEDLIGDKHDEILGMIANRFNLTPKLSKFERVEEKVGWSSIYDQKTVVPDQVLDDLITVFPESFLGYESDSVFINKLVKV